MAFEQFGAAVLVDESEHALFRLPNCEVNHSANNEIHKRISLEMTWLDSTRFGRIGNESMKESPQTCRSKSPLDTRTSRSPKFEILSMTFEWPLVSVFVSNFWPLNERNRQKREDWDGLCERGRSNYRLKTHSLDYLAHTIWRWSCDIGIGRNDGHANVVRKVGGLERGCRIGQSDCGSALDHIVAKGGWLDQARRGVGCWGDDCEWN